MKECRVCLEMLPTGSFVRYSTGGRQKISKDCKRAEAKKFSDKKRKALKEWRSYYA